MESDRTELGQRIRRVRTDKESTQDAVAESAGITQEYLSQIEAGIREPSLAVLRRLAAALSVEIGVLLGPISGKSEKISAS